MSRAATLVVVVASLLSEPANAARVYRFVDYPGLQVGHVVSGALTTTDSASDDGVLNLAEILDWQWEVRDGSDVIAGQLQPADPDSRSAMQVQGIEIDSRGVYLSDELGSILRLQVVTNLNSRGFNDRWLTWASGFADSPSRYTFGGVTEGDIAFLAWGAELPTHPGRWLIAASVPEPRGVALLCCAIAAIASRRRHKVVGWAHRLRV